MKRVVISMVFVGSAAFAQNLPREYMTPGSSKVFYDYQTQQTTQVICSGQPQPPPVMGPSCELRYNPIGNSCTTYVVYANNSPVSPCLADLDQVEHSLSDYYASGACSRPMPGVCTLKYNPAGNPCTDYVYYLNNAPITGCMASMDTDVIPAKQKLVQMGVCRP